MGKVSSYKCDGFGCGKDKGEANHWWVLWVDLGQLHLERLEHVEARGPLTPRMEILCGQECVSKKVSEFMGAAR